MSDRQRNNNNTPSSAGLDFVYTKVAVDFQNTTAATVEQAIADNLALLRETARLDGICVARFDARHRKIEKLTSVIATDAGCNPDYEMKWTVHPPLQNTPMVSFHLNSCLFPLDLQDASWARKSSCRLMEFLTAISTDNDLPRRATLVK